MNRFTVEQIKGMAYHSAISIDAIRLYKGDSFLFVEKAETGEYFSWEQSYRDYYPQAVAYANSLLEGKE